MATKRKREPEAQTSMRIPVLAVRDVVHFPGQVNPLHVVRETSLRAIRKANVGNTFVLVLSQRDMAVDDPTADDLFRFGTLCEPLQTIPLPDASIRVALRGLQRARATSISLEGGCFWAEVETVAEVTTTGPAIEALERAAVQAFTEVVEQNPEIPPEALQGLSQIELPGPLADAIAHHLPIRSTDKQSLLEELNTTRRLELTLEILRREAQILSLKRSIHARVEEEIGQSHRDYYLREQLRIIQNELREREDRVGEVDEYRQKIEASGMPEEVQVRAESEIRRLDRTPPASPEGMVLRNYLETLIALPWKATTADQLDVPAATRLLDERHYGLARVKDRILDYLAVRQLRGSMRGPILCFQGPPGVGKTSIARSIADAMGRKFVRIALGGIRDEAEIRGHRRTYVGSLPGRIIQGLIDCGSRNPVILFDEIDKLAGGSLGDPTSALLEALDPEQNTRFSDHYVEVPFDLSHVMFLATANLLDNVPAALRDRMEIISFPSYTADERTVIAREFLIPEAIIEHGLHPKQFHLPEEGLKLLVNEYTREPGVRGLGRQVNTLCRKAARQVAEGRQDSINLTPDLINTWLGPPKFSRTSASLEPQIGCAWALVVSEAGGDLVPIEVALTPCQGDQPNLVLTGNLGTVMRESAQAAFTAIRAHFAEAEATKIDFHQDVHIHVPEAAVPKDGPSAGITLAVALASAFLKVPVRGDVALTGEITLRGRLLPVGGVPEKMLAASRAGMTMALLPTGNVSDLSELPEGALGLTEVHRIDSLADALARALVQP